GCRARCVCHWWRLIVIPWFLALALAAGGPVSGIVKDPSGGVVPGASVIVKPASGSEHQALTGPDGRFKVDMPDSGGDVTVVVRAGGFAEKSRRVVDGDRGREIEIVLEPATLLETV